MSRFGMARTARARHIQGKMNKMEEAYARTLEIRKMAGAIRDWRFEPFKLRLADKTYYSPDFLVITTGDELEIHETKGYFEDDARAKVKIAAEQFPWFRFRVIRLVKKAWDVENIPPHDA